MSRIAVGDLMIDLDIPGSFACEYSLSGSLIAVDEARAITLEVSALTISPADPVEVHAGEKSVLGKVDAGERHLLKRDESLVIARQAPHWFAGIGNRVVIATLDDDTLSALSPSLEQELQDVLGSVAPAHDPFPPPSDRPAFSDLRASHRLWFRQRRRSLREALDHHSELPIPLGKLDAFWAELVSSPEPDPELLFVKLSALSVALGDHLVSQGFEWCIVSDQWGVEFGVVGLRGKADFTLTPESFVGSRWERREPPFLEGAVESILERFAELRASFATALH